MALSRKTSRHSRPRRAHRHASPAAVRRSRSKRALIAALSRRRVKRSIRRIRGGDDEGYDNDGLEGGARRRRHGSRSRSRSPSRSRSGSRRRKSGSRRHHKSGSRKSGGMSYGSVLSHLAAAGAGVGATKMYDKYQSKKAGGAGGAAKK